MTRALAEFAARLPGSGISESAREAASRSLVDTLACAVAGLREGSSRTLLQVVDQEAAAGPCTAIGLARKITPREAALVNGCLARALDFDDTHDLAVLHPGVAVIPGGPGRGGERGGRWSRPARCHHRGLRRPGPRGPGGHQGARPHWVALHLRLRGLRRRRRGRTIARARPRPDGRRLRRGPLPGLGDAAVGTRRHLGQAAAARPGGLGGNPGGAPGGPGLSGAQEALEGRFGFFRVYLREYDPAPVLASLGRSFEVERTSLKPFPTCRFTDAPIAALQEILARGALPPSGIERIEARVTSAAYAEVCEPLREKVRPASPVHAQFSLPYALACVADHGTVGLADLTEEGLQREAVLALAERVHCVRDRGLEAKWGERIGEAEVRLWMRDGAGVTGRALPPGGPERPMPDADLTAKVKMCLDWGGSGLDPTRLIEAVNALRYTGTTHSLREILAPGWPSSTA